MPELEDALHLLYTCFKWKSLFLGVCDKHAPIRIKRLRASRSPWINNDLKKTMYRGDRLKKIASITKNPEDWNNYKKMRNQVNNAIKNAKRSYYYNTFKTYDCNSRKTWQVINEITSRKSGKSVINELECNGKKTNNPTEIAETFNTFFSEIGSELSKKEFIEKKAIKSLSIKPMKNFLLKL